MTRILVVAAVIEREGRFLVTRRQHGVHLAGFWEFPGGKVADGESHTEALCREMHEELDVNIVMQDLVLETSHEYTDRVVTLFFYRCDVIGTPTPMIGQEMNWVARDALSSLNFPPADDELIRRLTGV
ncbi:MAG TPA: (deoxy)nucleoside triphosphate pyrophosphohydrolase [Vicinamibacterales bacterium]|nr:(deoxy)nucleoside triphosphate pyrophosphohydrolase [Vicinamibacterales bacterium]